MAGHYIVKEISTEYLEDATNAFKKSLDSWMYPYETREHFSQRMTKAIYGEFSKEEIEALKETFALVEGEMQKAIQSNPIDFRQYLFLGQLYNSYYRISGDEEKLDKAEEVLTKAIELGPTNQQGYWNLAETKVARGKVAQAIELLEKSVELEPLVGNSHWYLAMAYNIAGEIPKTLESIKKAEEAGYDWKKDLTSIQRVIEIYQGLGDDSNLIPLYLKAIELSPKNTSYWASLASSYANIGEYQKAEEAAVKVKEIDPESAEEINNFINQLP
jgi:tetratricopeptide (TPR) repeat protein